MYTQCPECESAFRVTAAVLRKAAGMVRCGSCGHAFNSLDYLSEEKPSPPEPAAEIPELVPEPPETAAANVRARLPRRMSAEQSAALLKTLDQLAGEDIRIEDTGVEWRVLGDDEEDDAATGDELLEDPEVTSAYHLDADEDEPTPDASPEASGLWILEDPDALEPVQDSSQEIPDDAAATVVEDASLFGDRETVVDELLDDNPTPVDEVLDESPAEIDAADLFQSGTHDSPDIDDADVFEQDIAAQQEDTRPAHEEMRFDDNTPLPDDFDEADEHIESTAGSQSAQPVESPPDNGMQAELALGNPDEWEQLLSEFETLATEASDHGLNGEKEPEEASEEQAPVDDDSTEPAPLAEAWAGEADQEDEQDEASLAEVFDEANSLSASLDEEGEDPDREEPVAATAEDPEDDALDFEEMLEPDEEGLVDEGEHDRETDDEGLPQLVAIGDEDKDHPHYVPPMTEEEETINMLIDQDLLAIAQVDDDGFASTIVFEKGKEPVNVESVIIGETDDPDAGEDDQDVDTNDADEEPAVVMPAAEAEDTGDSPAKKYGIPAAAALLALALIVQVVHQQRANLATIPAAENLLSPVYEAIGSPITPNWDVSGWDIARTRGATDENEALLTIFSELRNTSAKALPYPVVTLSLTDRYQDPVGALVLEPADYLAAGADPSARIAPGERFEATIPIDSPSADAIGYTINACYRQADGDLRCAVDDFK